MKSLLEATEAIQNLNIIRHLLPDDGTFPNNALLPLLIYPRAIHFLEEDEERIVKDIFESNGWTNSWKDGIYDYHHYHSTAHEVLGIIYGTARIQFGGPSGITLYAEKGDVIIIPAGVAHKKLDGDDDFLCIGAYPEGQQYDMNYGKNSERPKADQNIKNLALPDTDPVYGMNGPLIKNWTADPDVITNAL